MAACQAYFWCWTNLADRVMHGLMARNDLSADFRALMERAGLSPADLACATGISIRLIRKYRKGESSVGPDNAPAIATALRCSKTRLLYGQEH